MTTFSQADPVPETVKNMVSPDQSGAAYVAKRYLLTELEGGSANSPAFAVRNPEGVDCIITNVIVHITSAGGRAGSVMDVDAVASYSGNGDSIIDGLDLNSVGTSDRHKNGGTNGGAPVKWDKRGGANDFVTGRIRSQGADNLSGKVIIEYVPLA